MFHTYRQYDACDCGVACLRMIARHHGKKYTAKELSDICHPTRNGVSLLDLSEAAQKIGLHAVGARLSEKELIEKAPLPCILHWNQHHFVVCYKINYHNGQPRFHIADPASKSLVYKESEFTDCWANKGAEGHVGVALLLEPTDRFYKLHPKSANGVSGFRLIRGYFTAHSRSLSHVLLAMSIVSVLQLATPYLTQRMVDTGIGKHDIGVVRLIFIAQLTVIVSSVAVGMIRNWLTLYINTRINISLVSDFLRKMMCMPLHFFDTKLVGDLTQRMRDNDRIESFLTGSSVETLFSAINFIVLVFVLVSYDIYLFLIFIIGNTAYIAWTQFLMSKRRSLDLKRFNQLADEQDTVLQIIHGIRDIKLFNCERQKLWEWERLQAKIFNTKSSTLAIAQLQQFGALLFSQSTSLIISYMAACKVVEGSLTIGGMMAIAYIIGQISSPIASFVDFMCSLQYARLSLDRLSELHDSNDEFSDTTTCADIDKQYGINVKFDHVWFSYKGTNRNHVLKDISFTIPPGKVTAVVGESGCGKTTLMKLILGFYSPTAGNIYVGDTPLKNIEVHKWRDIAGCVLQDGYVFSTDIAHNIALGDDRIDKDRLLAATRTACIDEFINSIPSKYTTKIGMDGCGLSQGQKQRLLIARAVYKSPEILVLDEATNALDSKTEKKLMCNLQTFYKGRTVVVAAHRLSTIKNADNIIVVSNGRIAEQGTHRQLIKKHGEYFNLVHNQIDSIENGEG